MIRVKICGITRPEDARLAAQAGADAIGLNFVPGSPRALDAYHARQILAVLPPFVTPVGVFMDAPVPQVRSMALSLGIRTVQLHGDEPVEAVGALAPLCVIKALPVRDEAVYAELRRWTGARVAGILLDKPRTAQRSDPAPMPWNLLTPERLETNCGPLAPIILAGGLTPDNVAEAVGVVRPYGVDVASGVERGAGVKDADLVKGFILGARGGVPTQGADRHRPFLPEGNPSADAAERDRL